MVKLVVFLLIIVFISASYQTILSRSLERCRRATSSCVLSPELTEGPYYWNTSQMRQNIKDDRMGVAFRLQVVVMDVNTCSPIANAAVTLWHCDAMGLYSHYIEASQNVQNPKNDNATFLRGIQLTNATGVATFDTIYPGWYIGRTTHMHVKVHLGGTYLSGSSYYSGATYVHTGQLFFNDSLTDLVAQQSPYNTHSVTRMQNSQDNIYASGGSSTLMNVQYVNSQSGMSSGLVTYVTLGVASTITNSSSSTSSTSKVTTTKTPSSSSTRRSMTTTTKRTTTIKPSTTTKRITTTSRRVNLDPNQPRGPFNHQG